MSRLKIYRVIFIMCVALGWWGVWFPELAVWTEAICIAEETDDAQIEKNVAEYESAREIFNGLMHAQRDQIRIRSRFLEIVERYLQSRRD